MRTVAVVRYTIEVTLDLCLESLRASDDPFDKIEVFKGRRSVRRSFNDALDYAHGQGLEWLFVVPADTIVYQNAVGEFKREMRDGIFWLSALGKDAIFGRTGSGITVFNTDFMGDRYRHSLDDPCATENLCEKVKRETGWVNKQIPLFLSVHHPIWTPFEMFMKMRWHVQKLHACGQGKEAVRYREFFERETRRLPDNLTLRIGADMYGKMMEAPEDHALGDKSVEEMRPEWEEFKKGYPLKGNEFYAMSGWETMARRLVHSESDNWGAT